MDRQEERTDLQHDLSIRRNALGINPGLDESRSPPPDGNYLVPSAVHVSPGGSSPQGIPPVSATSVSVASKNVDGRLSVPFRTIWEDTDSIPFRTIREDTDSRPMTLDIAFESTEGPTTEAQTDCGALLNAISESWFTLHEHGSGTPEAPDFHFALADGSQVLSKGSIDLTLIMLHADGHETAKTRFQIMPTRDSWTVLLGRPWLKVNSIIMDYGQDVLTMPTDSGPKSWNNERSGLAVQGTGSDTRAIRAVGKVERDDWDWNAQPEPLEDGPTTEDRADKVLAKITIGSDLTETQRNRVQDLIRRRHRAFALDLSEVKPCLHTQHKLTVNPDIKLTRKPFGRPLSEPEVAAAFRQVDKLLKAGIIKRCRPKEVLCCAPIVMAPKKPDPTEMELPKLIRMADDAIAEVVSRAARLGIDASGHFPSTTTTRSAESNESPETSGNKSMMKEQSTPEYRMCHNFTQINRATSVVAFPPGDLEQKVLRHSGKRFISKIDALGAFYWVELEESLHGYLCFYVQGLGYMRYQRLPMGPTGSPGTYQVALERTLHDLLDFGPLSAWMDDVFMGCDDFEHMFTTLDTLLMRAEADNLMFAPAKTFLFVERTTIGGSVVDQQGVSPDPKKVSDLLDWPTPMSVRDVLSFVNTAAVFRSSIPHSAEIASPLYDLTKDLGPTDGKKGGHKRALEGKDVRSLWSIEHELAFVKLKTALTSFPVVMGPIYDGTPFHVVCDASAKGFGAHLYQETSEGTRTTTYASRGTNAVKAKQHLSELELRGAKWAMEKFEKWTYGQKIVLHTDCQAVKDLLKSDTSSGYRAGWKESIVGGRIVKFVHRPGVDNTVADNLSRIGVGAPENMTMGWEERKEVANSLVQCRLVRARNPRAVQRRPPRGRGQTYVADKRRLCDRQARSSSHRRAPLGREGQGHDTSTRIRLGQMDDISRRSSDRSTGTRDERTPRKRSHDDGDHKAVLLVGPTTRRR